MNEIELIQYLIADKRRITAERIDELVFMILDHAESSLASGTVRGKANKIVGATIYAEKRRLMSDLLDFFDRALSRQALNEKIVDYTKWRLGQKTYMGDKIGVCPVCGRKGEISPPNDEYDFCGATTHVSKPFFMGQSIIDKCEWPKPL